MLQYRKTGTMGVGVFATEDIPQGTRILIDPPLFVMPTDYTWERGRWPIALNPWYVEHGFSQEPLYDSEIDFFCRRVMDVGIADQGIAAMEALFYDEESATRQETLDAFRCTLWALHREATDFDTMFRLWGVSGGGFPAPGVQLNGITQKEYQIQAMSRLAVRYATLYAIWHANHFGLAEGSDADYGVFRLASRVNHSCMPNVSRSWVNIGGYVKTPAEQALDAHSPKPYMALTLNTISDIRRGDQIFMAYEDQTFRLPAERKLDLQRTYRIEACVCKLCTDPMVCALQYRAWGLYHATRHWLNPNPPINTAVVVWDTTVLVARSAFDALAMAEGTSSRD